MDKQDKTAEDFDGGELLDLCQKYAQYRTAELEDKIKELEKDLSTNKRVLKMYVDLINGQGEKILALEEQLKAADEVINSNDDYAANNTWVTNYEKALAKYQSLKK